MAPASCLLAAWIATVAATPVATPGTPGPDHPVRGALAKRVAVAVDQLPLDAALRRLAEAAEVTIVIDAPGLRQAQVRPGAQVGRLPADAHTLAQVLDALLRPLKLTHAVAYGAIVVTTPTRTSRVPRLPRSLPAPLAGLLDRPLSPIHFRDTERRGVLDYLVDSGGINLVDMRADRQATAPLTATLDAQRLRLGDVLGLCVLQWDDVVWAYESVLVVGSTSQRKQFQRLAALLPALPKGPDGRRARMRVTFDFAASPLRDALAFLRDIAGINIVVDVRRLQRDRRRPDTPVSLRVRDVPWHVGLGLTLLKTGLVYTWRGRTVWVTTPAGLEPSQRTRPRKLPPEVREALSRPATFYFDRSPLRDVVGFVRQVAGVNVLVDWRALRAARVGPQSTVTIRVDRETWINGLTLMLAQLGLDFGWRHGALYISTPAGLARSHPPVPRWPEPVLADWRRPLAVSFQRTPLARVIEFLGTHARSPIRYAPDARAKLDARNAPPVDLTLRNVPAQDVFHYVLDQGGLWYRVGTEGGLTVTPAPAGKTGRRPKTAPPTR